MTKKSPATHSLPKGCKAVIQGLKSANVRILAMVTDTNIAPLITEIFADPFFHSVRCCSEEEAIAIATGATLTGRRGATIFQNAGLFSSGRGIVLAQTVSAPVLMLVSHRGGEQEPAIPYHIYKGEKTKPLLDALRVHQANISPDQPIENQVARAADYAQAANEPFALLFSEKDLK